jgi:ligand-binding SRPBCC domain-containing protein
MDYHHRFLANAPLEDVLAFHRSASSLAAITPPIFFMRNLEGPATLGEGSTISFILWLGPLPVRWRACIVNVTPAGFDDILIAGPFASWVHEHRFEARPDGTCLVHDHIHFTLKSNLLWRAVGLLMALGLPLLFAYRASKTQSMLSRSNA